MEINPASERNTMQTYAILYSYPTIDRYYRGQKATTIQARSEAHARAIIKGETPDARILRLRIK